MGCDSIITLNLTMNESIAVSIIQTGNTLSADYQGGTYKWIDCSTNSPINGATNLSYNTSKNGTYAVIVNNNNCLDTSACYPFIYTSVKEIRVTDLCKIYPNPSHGEFSIELIANEAAVFQIEIAAITGKTVYSNNFNIKQNTQLKLNLLEHGIYLITVSNEKNVIKKKIVIE
jgi:hypothetical protein